MTSGADAATVVLVYHAMSIRVLALSMTGPHSRGEKDSQLGGNYVH
jgi:hypothetical protein